MGMYALKTPDPVEAVQFHGGTEEAAVLCDWVTSKGGFARYLDTIRRGNDIVKVEPYIMVVDDSWSSNVQRTDWLTTRGDGIFVVYTDEKFVELYDPLDPLDILRRKLTANG